MPPMLFWWIVACWFVDWGMEFNGFGVGWRIEGLSFGKIMERGWRMGFFGFVWGAFH